MSVSIYKCSSFQNERIVQSVGIEVKTDQRETTRGRRRGRLRDEEGEIQSQSKRGSDRDGEEYGKQNASVKSTAE